MGKIDDELPPGFTPDMLLGSAHKVTPSDLAKRAWLGLKIAWLISPILLTLLISWVKQQADERYVRGLDFEREMSRIEKTEIDALKRQLSEVQADIKELLQRTAAQRPH